MFEIVHLFLNPVKLKVYFEEINFSHQISAGNEKDQSQKNVKRPIRIWIHFDQESAIQL